MTDFGLPPGNLDRLRGIPVQTDLGVPAGAAVLEVDPDEPRHVTRIRTADHRVMVLTAEQIEQVREHYRAMDERAGRLLAEWRAMERFAAAAVPDPPHPPYLITGV